MKWPSGVPWCMTTTWSTTYVVEKCDVMWKLPHPVLIGGSERQLRKLTFGNDLADYNVGNPINCNCNIKWIIGKLKPVVLLNGQCVEPESLKGTQLRYLKEDNFRHCH
ncbi:hypothetical protein AVEN_275707-1 [Araneus ventricosus]|uniref:LRRCT domain-containing protein n=1 Tax=Araneus ventricosus TaxID=182803 RepID=A0A4Y2WVJ2_ARAVE|nr:hypothetical protein AVEN_275707-1 [Araneus ventricosus]